MMKYAMDLHMHSTASDGTDSPAELLCRVRQAGLKVFSLTDHDAIHGSVEILDLLSPGDPHFFPGVEFSCKDALGKYHILGYGYQPDAKPIQDVVELGHAYRMKKLTARLEFLRTKFGFRFPDAAIRELYAQPNPGKPHVGNLMVRLGFARSKEQAIREFLNRQHIPDDYVKPEEAISGILGAGGVPVLAHPCFGDGDQIIVDEELDARVKRLMGFGLQGVEAFYSGFSQKLRNQVLELADRHGLYVTAGSDYHGRNKLIELGDTGLSAAEALPAGMTRFLARVLLEADAVTLLQAGEDAP